MLFADVIVDISHENLDRTYQYRVPEELEPEAVIGAPVEIPFGAGNRSVRGYLIGLSEEPKFDINRIKPLKAIASKSQFTTGSVSPDTENAGRSEKGIPKAVRHAASIRDSSSPSRERMKFRASVEGFFCIRNHRWWKIPQRRRGLHFSVRF